MPSRLPNFLYLGPDKSGSTWLFEVLHAHPDCCVPACKDIYFFDEQYERGMDWYQSFFAECPDSAVAIGELSHGYLFSSEAVDRIYNDLPDVKLMASLRDPVERCFSHYLYLVSSGLVKTSFEETVEVRPGVVRSSLYSEPVGRFLDRFGKERFKVLFFDDLKRDPKKYAEEVYDFLGLQFNNDFEYGKKVRAARKPRSFLAARVAKLGALTARKMGMAQTVGKIKRSRLANVLYKNYQQGEKPVINPDTRAKLIKKFEPDIAALESMLDVDLSDWRKV